MCSRLTSVADLASAGLVPDADTAALNRVAQRYATAITPQMAGLIDRDDPHDPIGLQFVPSTAELETTPEERRDPIGDDTHSPVPGVVHRYPDRALLKVVHACPVYCRFCFRRESVGPGGDFLAGDALDAALAYIGRTPEIWEVILTGGDPLVLSPRRLANVIKRLAAIDHVAVIRLHSRVPVVSPDLISDAMVDALKAGGRRAAVWLAIHTNHPRELTNAALDAIARIADAGIPLVSQTVLLAGINDSASVLEALFRTLVANRVKPYYLHHGDYAPGTAHFRTGVNRGRAVTDALRGRVSGLCQPTYVLDIPDGYGKAPIGSTAAHGSDDAGWTVRDYRGRDHAYPPSPLQTGPDHADDIATVAKIN